MSYTALYRKRRPKQFGEVIGQTQIIRTLQNQIKNSRVSHAYLFCGTRGTGKTSTAKVFAQVINCPNNHDGDACGTCEICQAIQEQRSLNVIEMDAASNNGVDHIREIREEVQYTPAQGKFKVYIIDEVHMLSTGAFNALLKTLEEPPAHVIFILATTDPQKIPPTILSRCQRFDFKRIPTKVMVDTIKRYMEEDGVDIADEALSYIVSLADGAMRDALSILDQCTAFYFDETITMEKVQDVVGAVDQRLFVQLVEAFLSFDATAVLSLIEQVVMDGRDIGQFVSDITGFFRNLLVIQSMVSGEIVLDMSAEQIERLQPLAKKMHPSTLIEYIQAFSALQSQLKYANNPRVRLEVECIRLCNPETKDSYQGLFARLNKLEQQLAEGVPMKVVGKKDDMSPQENPEEKPQVYIEKAVPEDLQEVITTFGKFAKEFGEPLRAMLELGFAGSLEGSTLYIVCDNDGNQAYAKKMEDQIQEKLNQYYQKTFPLEFITKKEYQRKHEALFGIKDAQDRTFNPQNITDKINFPVEIR